MINLNRMAPPPTPPGSCDCGPGLPYPTNNCAPGVAQPKSMLVGKVPILFPTCPGDKIIQAGRINAAWVPRSVVENQLARGADFSPTDPLQDQDVFTTTPVTLTLEAPAPSGLAQGEAFLYSGMIIEFTSSNNTSPGVSTFNIGPNGDSTDLTEFEDGSPYAQTCKVVTGHTGLSRYVLMFTRETEGGAYPALVAVNSGTILTKTGSPVSAVTRHYTQKLYATFTCPPGTGIRIEGLSPVSELWFQALAMWEASAKLADGVARGY